VLAKCAAGRQRDWDYVREALREHVVEIDVLLSRTADLPLPAAECERIAEALRGISAERVD
jgi:hypothetical protein